MLSPFFCLSTGWKWPKQFGIVSERNWERGEAVSEGKWTLKQITKTWSKGQCCSNVECVIGELLSLCISAFNLFKTCGLTITLSFHVCTLKWMWNNHSFVGIRAEVLRSWNICRSKTFPWGQIYRSPDESHEFQKHPVKTQIWIWQAGGKGILALDNAQKKSSFRETKSTTFSLDPCLRHSGHMEEKGDTALVNTTEKLLLLPTKDLFTAGNFSLYPLFSHQ